MPQARVWFLNRVPSPPARCRPHPFILGCGLRLFPDSGSFAKLRTRGAAVVARERTLDGAGLGMGGRPRRVSTKTQLATGALWPGSPTRTDQVR
jgi:hypothetical protein